MIYVGVNYQDTIQICSFPPLACDQQRLSQPFLFDLDVQIFLKFRELFLKNGMVALFQVKEKTTVVEGGASNLRLC